jgi:hypothetical protein
MASSVHVSNMFLTYRFHLRVIQLSQETSANIPGSL